MPLILIVAVPSAVKPRLSVTNVKLWGDPESQPVAEQDGCINFDRKVLSSWSPMSNCGPVSQSIFIKELDRYQDQLTELLPNSTCTCNVELSLSIILIEEEPSYGRATDKVIREANSAFLKSAMMLFVNVSFFGVRIVRLGNAQVGLEMLRRLAL